MICEISEINPSDAGKFAEVIHSRLHVPLVFVEALCDLFLRHEDAPPRPEQLVEGWKGSRARHKLAVLPPRLPSDVPILNFKYIIKLIW